MNLTIRCKLGDCKYDDGTEVADAIYKLHLFSCWLQQNTQTELEVFSDEEPEIRLGTIYIDYDYEIKLED